MGKKFANLQHSERNQERWCSSSSSGICARKIKTLMGFILYQSQSCSWYAGLYRILNRIIKGVIEGALRWLVWSYYSWIDQIFNHGIIFLDSFLVVSMWSFRACRDLQDKFKSMENEICMHLNSIALSVLKNLPVLLWGRFHNSPLLVFLYQCLLGLDRALLLASQ